MIRCGRRGGALLVGFAALLSRSAQAQSFTWKNQFAFYLDNTEFFNPYRTGETILGGQLQSYVSTVLGPRTEVIAGFFGNHFSGRDDFFDSVKPVLGFRYHTATSLGALGTLVTESRHGYLEPLQGTLLELTRPIEYGVQWRERRVWGGGEAFLNWQQMNTSSKREIFDYGFLLHASPVRPLTLELQAHGLHHGGQLHRGGEPVGNNQVLALGGTVAGAVPVAGQSSLRLFQLLSHGNVGAAKLEGTPDHGHGTYLRVGFSPGGWLEVFTIQWWGRDFVSNEGDHSYNSQGSDSSFYRARRRYQEFGFIRRTSIEAGLTLDTEFRFHRFDRLRSIAIGTSSWEYSYRLVVRAPFEIRLGS
jgi:hypothetical protein